MNIYVVLAAVISASWINTGACAYLDIDKGGRTAVFSASHGELISMSETNLGTDLRESRVFITIDSAWHGVEWNHTSYITWDSQKSPSNFIRDYLAKGVIMSNDSQPLRQIPSNATISMSYSLYTGKEHIYMSATLSMKSNPPPPPVTCNMVAAPIAFGALTARAADAARGDGRATVTCSAPTTGTLYAVGYGANESVSFSPANTGLLGVLQVDGKDGRTGAKVTAAPSGTSVPWSVTLKTQGAGSIRPADYNGSAILRFDVQ